LSFIGGRLVHKMTLSAVGSPDATPCGKRSRRSLASKGILLAHPFVVAMAKPMNADCCKNLRRVESMRFLSRLLFYAGLLFGHVHTHLKYLADVYWLGFIDQGYSLVDQNVSVGLYYKIKVCLRVQLLRKTFSVVKQRGHC